MTRRPPSPPPELPGFSYLEALGTGGFADVFLYEQAAPRRLVAVKVLLADRLTSGAAQAFAREADVMAMLSTHPAIVTIYQTGVAADGRPYLVMEYCPRANLQQRLRAEPFSVAEALRVGIQVAGAVETAHRAGVLHRDIKPANILVTEYNRPALTDFGIATTADAAEEAEGMSVPWSPPESFEDPPRGGVPSDVYALGATVYSLLTGRAPFERSGERNTADDLITRVTREPLPPLGRADAPESLQRALDRSMAKNTEDRFPNAVAFARALQKVQIELSHSVTPLDIIDEHPGGPGREEDDDGRTRVRRVVASGPQAPAQATEHAAEPPAERPAEPPAARRLPVPPASSTHPATPGPASPPSAAVPPEPSPSVAAPPFEPPSPSARPRVAAGGRGMAVSGLVLSGVATVIGVISLVVGPSVIAGMTAPPPSADDVSTDDGSTSSDEGAADSDGGGDPLDLDVPSPEDITYDQTIFRDCYTFDGPTLWLDNTDATDAAQCVTQLETSSEVGIGSVDVTPVDAATAESWSPDDDLDVVVDVMQTAYFAEQSGTIATLYETATLDGVDANITRFESGDEAQIKAVITAYAPLPFEVGSSGEKTRLFIVSVVAPHSDGDQLLQQVLDSWVWEFVE